MRKQAEEILKMVDELNKEFPSSDEAINAMRVLIFEKRLEKILGGEKYQGVSIRELNEGRLMLVHSGANMYCKKTAANAVEIEIRPYN